MSLLKMNQKFLSKSSWSIRGGGNNNNNSNSNSGANKSHFAMTANNAINNSRQFAIGRPPVIKSGAWSEKRPLQSTGATHNSGTGRAIDARSRLQPTTTTTTTHTPTSLRASKFADSSEELVIDLKYKQSQLACDSLSNLKRTKGMSHSITDLRELKEKPAKAPWVDENDEFQHEIKERRIDMYIAEIELEPIFQLGSTIRAIYDGNEQDCFMEKLDARIKNHDKDIERMCNCHYQGFVDCIHELLKVRPQAAALKSEISQSNQELLKSTENIQRKADELIKSRRVLCNTKTAIEHLQELLPMLETFSKLNQQMEEKKYYSALKTLEQFKKYHMDKITNYRFTKSICDKVPTIVKTIKDESRKDLNDFLENIQKLTPRMGEIAIKHAAVNHKSKEFALILNKNKYFDWKERSMNNLFAREKSDDSVGSGRVNGVDGVTTGDHNGDEGYLTSEEELSATDLVDFTPVYRCLHIFDCLEDDESKQYYREQRQKQAQLILQSISLTNSNHFFTGDHFRNCLFGVIGFFVIEDYLFNTSNGLITREYLVENWTRVLTLLIKNVQEQVTRCQDAKQILYMKSLLLLFCHTAQSYGHSVEPLMKLLVELRQLYTDILLNQWSSIFRKIFDADNYHPLMIGNQSEFEEYFSDDLFGEVDAAAKGDSFPRKYPFSSFVPMVYKALREFIIACLEFARDLDLSDNEKEDAVRKTTNVLLNRTLSDSLSSLIRNPNLGLLQLIQISINTNYLEEAGSFLEVFISKLIHNKIDMSADNLALFNLSPNLQDEASQTYLARLQGRSMFKDARSEAESQIYTRLNRKIDEFFGLASYDYLLQDSTGRASPYILDLIAFLRSTFEAFTNLPLKVAQTACISACKYISATMLNILLEEDVKAVSHGFLEQFNLDLVQCEMFAGSEPVGEFEEGALQSCFAELRQTMDLFIEFDSWANYFAEHGKNESRYLRVNPQTALILLEKLVRGDSKKTIFASLSKNERDKKNKIDTILKKLKQMVHNGTNS